MEYIFYYVGYNQFDIYCNIDGFENNPEDTPCDFCSNVRLLSCMSFSGMPSIP